MSKVGRRPERFGFIKAPDGVWVPHHKEHWIVRKIMELHRSGLTPLSIYRLLKENELKNRYGETIARYTIEQTIKRANEIPHGTRVSYYQ
ncbi:hypothetical protein GC174_17505 [bacterium]|nr:hypothetical protein [bacterium]